MHKTGTIERISERLKTLHCRSAALETKIAHEVLTDEPNWSTIARLKRLRAKLETEIKSINQGLREDAHTASNVYRAFFA